MDDECAVELEHRERQPLDIAQRGISGAEIVHCKLNACLPQLLHARDRDVDILQRERFGQLDFQPARIKLIPLQCCKDQIADVVEVEVCAGEVDRHDDRLDALRLPELCLPACLIQHKTGDMGDQLGFFRDRDERSRREQSAGRMLPADQRFQSHDLAGFQRDLRLIIKRQFIAHDGIGQFGFEVALLNDAVVHFRCIAADAAVDIACRGKCKFGMLHDVFKAFAVRGHACIACRAGQRTACQRTGRHFRECPLHALDRLFRQRVVAGVPQDQREIVAGDARRKAAEAQLLGDRTRKAFQQLIARGIAAGIIDEVEAVDVHDDHPVFCTEIAGRLIEILAHAHELVPVRDPGDGILIGDLFDFGVLCLLLCDVDDGAACNKPAGFIALRDLEPVGIPAVLPVRGADAQFDGFGLVQEIAHVIAHDLDMLIVGDGIERIDPAAERLHGKFCGGDAEHALQLLRGEHPRIALLDQQNADIHELHSQVMLPARNGQRFGIGFDLGLHGADIRKVHADRKQPCDAAFVGFNRAGVPDQIMRLAGGIRERVFLVFGFGQLADRIRGQFFFAEELRNDIICLKIFPQRDAGKRSQRIIQHELGKGAVPEHCGGGQVLHHVRKPFAVGFLFALCLALPVQNDQEAQQNGNQCVGVENQIDQFIFIAVVKCIDNQIDRKKRKSDHN